ncbi:hypothetical protein [Pseudomonas cichorii]|uniref:Uncharacterized protein n=1 Tax=Pseudomonas cichorii TaxID=36746 RepID=A0ABQ1DIE4_PSECI|nr:hypothetical protein [Pseudomonas cichorii]QVE15678.1 hypothetical protein KGD89_17525 [Pseudomonas cichorii]GFM90785.1 hypothetical protein PSCICP_07570 [Pseudomonas cichorii]SDN33565.1 hypothetical protein SAMN05216599_101662 [Pseudomonas cichorii]
MTVSSVRASMQHGVGFEILETRYMDKTLRVSVAKSANDLDTKKVEGDAQVHMTLIEKNKAVEKGVKEVFDAAKSGDSVVILCRSESIYKTVLKEIGFGE